MLPELYRCLKDGYQPSGRRGVSMAVITFVAPGGTTLHSNWTNPDDESVGRIAGMMAEAISGGGAWIIADATDGPATAVFFPVGSSVAVEFDGPLIPESLRTAGFVLGEAGEPAGQI